MQDGVPTVPPPEPPAEGWYAPAVLAQRAVHPGVEMTTSHHTVHMDGRLTHVRLLVEVNEPLK